MPSLLNTQHHILSQRYKNIFTYTHLTPKSLIKDKSISHAVKTTMISQEDKAISIRTINTSVCTWSYFSTIFHKNKAHCWQVLQWESSGTPCSTLWTPFSSPLFLATVITCLSHHTHAMFPPRQHIERFQVYTCLYGFPFAPAFYGAVLDWVALPGFCHQKKKKILRTDLHDLERLLSLLFQCEHPFTSLPSHF